MSVIQNNFEKVIPAVPNYQDRAVPVGEAFTFSEGVHDTGDNGIVIVDFASCIDLGVAEQKPELVQELFRLDHAAWAGVRVLPGYLHYYPDKVSETGEAHSYCAWRLRKHARASLLNTEHRDAVNFVIENPEVYKYYQVGTTIMRKVQSELQFELVDFRSISAGKLVEHWSKTPDWPQAVNFVRRKVYCPPGL